MLISFFSEWKVTLDRGIYLTLNKSIYILTRLKGDFPFYD